MLDKMELEAILRSKFNAGFGFGTVICQLPISHSGRGDTESKAEGENVELRERID